MKCSSSSGSLIEHAHGLVKWRMNEKDLWGFPVFLNRKGQLRCCDVTLSAGLHHEGIFRVSGSQVEVNDIKNAFERGNMIELTSLPSLYFLSLSALWNRWLTVFSCQNESRLLCFMPISLSLSLLSRPLSGEDPLAGDQNDHDMDSIAGVLKLYFRGLENALFPKEVFHDLMACVCECQVTVQLSRTFIYTNAKKKKSTSCDHLQ